MSLIYVLTAQLANADKVSQYGGQLVIENFYTITDCGLREGEDDFGQDFVLLDRPYVDGDLALDISTTCMAAVSISNVDPNAQCRALCVGAREEGVLPIEEFVSQCRVMQQVVDLEEDRVTSRYADDNQDHIMCSSTHVPVLPYEDTRYVTISGVENAFQCADMCQDESTCAWWVVQADVLGSTWNCYLVNQLGLGMNLMRFETDEGDDPTTCGPFDCECNGGIEVQCDSKLNSVCAIDGMVALGIIDYRDLEEAIIISDGVTYADTLVVGGPKVCYAAFSDGMARALCVDATGAALDSDLLSASESIPRIFNAFTYSVPANGLMGTKGPSTTEEVDTLSITTETWAPITEVTEVTIPGTGWVEPTGYTGTDGSAWTVEVQTNEWTTASEPATIGGVTWNSMGTTVPTETTIIADDHFWSSDSTKPTTIGGVTWSSMGTFWTTKPTTIGGVTWSSMGTTVPTETMMITHDNFSMEQSTTHAETHPDR